ncbi:hypothetical protein [Nocardia rosealba]|nr:hypothetical protein [Nocardia rosealba]MCA2206487.1 hypothetical protein [Nocardia rosealba]
MAVPKVGLTVLPMVAPMALPMALPKAHRAPRTWVRHLLQVLRNRSGDW